MDYKDKRWRKKREHILRLDGYRDVYALRYGKNIPANTVHHIYPAREYPQYRYCDWNLISLSAESHNKLENRNTRELTQEGKSLQKATIPGVDWRRNKARATDPAHLKNNP